MPTLVVRCVGLLVIVLSLPACSGNPSGSGAGPASAPSASPSSGGSADADQAAAIEAALAELSPDDAASARQQRVCLVGGEPLGSMGAPQKVEVQGQTVWICCEGCAASLQAEPDKYLAKLRGEAAPAQE